MNADKIVADLGALIAERDVGKVLLQEAVAERDDLQRRVDFLDDRLHSVADARNRIEADRDALRALVDDLRSSGALRDALEIHRPDLLARLDAAVKADQ